MVPQKIKHRITIWSNNFTYVYIYVWVYVFIFLRYRKMKTYVHTETCTWSFIAALFVIAKNWGEKSTHAHQLINGWTKMWLKLYNGTLLSHEKEKVLFHAATWMKLENIMLSGRKLQMAHVLWFHLYEIFRKVKSTETGSKLVVVRGIGWVRWELCIGFLFGMIKMIWNYIMVLVSQVWIS